MAQMLNDLQAYGSQADQYDVRTAPFQQWRRMVVDALPADAGSTVLDVGCGTGLCLPLLQDKVGEAGTVVGIDRSRQMLALTAKRVANQGWQNVRLISAPMGEASLDATADAAIFCAVHDVLQSPEALKNVFTHLRPGACVAAIGGKWPAPWQWGLRAWVATLHTPFVSDFANFDRPWELLNSFVPDLEVREVAWGTGYLATGHAKEGC